MHTLSSARPVAASTPRAAGALADPPAWPVCEGRLPLTDDAVTAIAAIADTTVRNLWITQSYADLARRMLELLPTDQTWCTFAIWASATAGESIRGEELPHVVTRLLLGADPDVDAVVRAGNRHLRLLRRLGVVGALQHSHVEHLVAEAVGQVAQHIAHGNTLVYAELAPLFVRFAERATELALGSGRAEVDHLLDAIGVPSPADAPLVRNAFEHYGLARCCDDPRERAEHVLAANVAAVLHEQQRLQADIAASMDAGILDVVTAAGSTTLRHLPRVVSKPLTALVCGRLARHLGMHVERLWQHVATALLMHLALPGETLDLGRDVPPLDDGERFPALLRSPQLDALRSLLAEWDPTGGTGIGSGAHDWADLHQRMGYIVNLFRSRQQDLVLTRPAFTAAQSACIGRDELPPTI